MDGMWGNEQRALTIVGMAQRDFNTASRNDVWSQILLFKKLEDLFFPEDKVIDRLRA